MNNKIGSAHRFEAGGKGLRFEVLAHKPSRGEGDAAIPAFVIKYESQFFAYLNRCGHIAVQLDYAPGEFFADDGNTLMCATHGAEYAPQTGACLGGPCYGVGLEPLEITVVDDDILLTDTRYSLIAASN